MAYNFVPWRSIEMIKYKQILTDGLWHRNPGLIQFLGICPLLAVSNTLENGLGLGAATLLVLTGSNLLVALLKPVIAEAVRLPMMILIIATLVTLVELVFEAWFFELWLSLGIFLPLIVTNCVILARAESFASRQPVPAALVDGLAHGIGFAAVLVALGGLREWLAASGFLLALLPPGAFLGLALLVAVRNAIQDRTDAASQSGTSPVRAP